RPGCRKPAPLAEPASSSRTRKPADWSTATRGWRWSKPEIRWIHSRGCAWYTSRSRCSSELIKDFRITDRRGGGLVHAIHPASVGLKIRPHISSSGTKTVKCVGNKNPGAHQAHNRCQCLNHRKSPFAPLHPTERLR